jgi:tRNA A37 N6-isopentenylltransferase MiaA
MIADIHSRGKLPIICGGTNYYIEALLFKKLTSLRKEETTSDIVIEKLNDKVSELIGLFKDDE